MNVVNILETLLSQGNGTFRTADAVNAGLSRMTLVSLVKAGKLERIAHGQYAIPDSLPDELYSLHLRSGKIVFSHETALFLHDMAVRTPVKHSLTIPSTAKLSNTVSDSCKVYYVQPEHHSLGVSSVRSKMGNELPVYDVERTICDILRSRNRIDSQTLAGALKSYSKRKDRNWGNLRDYAEAFRVTKLMRQYLEVLL